MDTVADAKLRRVARKFRAVMEELDLIWETRIPGEIGVDAFQADRSPTHMYRTAPLAGLWTHEKGGFYHESRFATLLDVVNHYDTFFRLNMTALEKNDLIQYLKGL